MRVDYLHLSPGQSPPSLPHAPFRAVIVAEADVEEAWRERIAAWLVEGGCLYAVAWGLACGAWEGSVDWAILAIFDFGAVPDERFVMTTCHADETREEAFWFAGQCAFHPDVELETTIIVHVSAEPREEQMLREFSDSQIMDSDL